MREIKFKAKKVDNGEWVEGYYVKDPKGRSRIYLQPFEEASSNTYYFVIPETVCQYTGVHNIWEGDINENGGICKYYAPAFKWSFEKNFPTSSIKNSDKVIGNIYDNPELK